MYNPKLNPHVAYVTISRLLFNPMANIRSPIGGYLAEIGRRGGAITGKKGLAAMHEAEA